MKKYKRTLQIVLPFLLLIYVGALIYLATSQTIPSISPFEDFDKVVHFAEFFILSILLLFTFAVYDYRDHRLLGLATALVLIVVSEIIQIPLLNRSFSIVDMMADLLGLGLGMILMYGVDMKWNFLKQFS